MKRLHIMLYVAMLVSMEIILTRFLSLQTPIVRISFGFIPVAFAAILFGPAIGGFTAALADILGMLLFPNGAYFPGFTLSALLGGVIYGVLLYDRPRSWMRAAAAVFIITVAVDIFLNTLWLSIITGKSAYYLIPPRIIKCAVIFPAQVFIVHFLCGYMADAVKKRLCPDRPAV